MLNTKKIAMENKIELIKKELQRRIKNLEELGSRDFIRKHFTEQYMLIEVYEGLINFMDSLADIDEAALEKKIEDYAYTLPHSSTGVGPNLKYYDDPSVKEARSNGWKHAWSYENVVKIVKHFIESESDSVHIDKAHEWIEHYIADATGIDSSALIESFDNFVKNGN